jgi:hypothetical protein
MKFGFYKYNKKIKKKYLVSGIGPGPTGVGRLMTSLINRLDDDYTYVYRRNAISIRELKIKKKYFNFLLEILKRKLDNLIFFIKVLSIKDSRILLLHPQTIGFKLFFKINQRNKIYYYVMDNSFFCVRSYNVHPVLDSECLQCLDVLKPHSKCEPSPVPMTQLENVEFLRNLKNNFNDIIFLSQNNNQSKLIKLHFGASVRVRVIGMNTNEIPKRRSTPVGNSAKYDIVFHGKSVIAKGVVYFINLASLLPNHTFFIPDSVENLNKIISSDLPHNIICENITWESGLLEIVKNAKLVINPSLWSAPIEGALVKSAYFNNNVATVKTRFGYENEVSFVRNHLRLSPDFKVASVQIIDFFESKTSN